MKKILLIIVILISSFSYYGAVNENGEKTTSFENLTQDNEIARNEQKEENVIAKNNNSNQSKTVNVKQNNTNASTNNNTQNKEETVKNTEEQAKTENTVQNQTKYVRNDTMIQKIKSVIENNVTEDMKKYGYTIVVDSSIKELTNQFTFTESRVISNIKYSFGTIRIYAEDYYSNGKLIMTECYIL